jgi:hypothetical protein
MVLHALKMKGNFGKKMQKKKLLKQIKQKFRDLEC